MADESKIYNKDGELIAIRTVEDYNGGKRVTTQEATSSPIGTPQPTKVIDDRDVYPDGSEYEHKGPRIK